MEVSDRVRVNSFRIVARKARPFRENADENDSLCEVLNNGVTNL